MTSPLTPNTPKDLLVGLDTIDRVQKLTAGRPVFAVVHDRTTGAERRAVRLESGGQDQAHSLEQARQAAADTGSRAVAFLKEHGLSTTHKNVVAFVDDLKQGQARVLVTLPMNGAGEKRVTARAVFTLPVVHAKELAALLVKDPFLAVGIFEKFDPTVPSRIVPPKFNTAADHWLDNTHSNLDRAQVEAALNPHRAPVAATQPPRSTPVQLPPPPVVPQPTYTLPPIVLLPPRAPKISPGPSVIPSGIPLPSVVPDEVRSDVIVATVAAAKVPRVLPEIRPLLAIEYSPPLPATRFRIQDYQLRVIAQQLHEQRRALGNSAESVERAPETSRQTVAAEMISQLKTTLAAEAKGVEMLRLAREHTRSGMNAEHPSLPQRLLAITDKPSRPGMTREEYQLNRIEQFLREDAIPWAEPVADEPPARVLAITYNKPLPPIGGDREAYQIGVIRKILYEQSIPFAEAVPTDLPLRPLAIRDKEAPFPTGEGSLDYQLRAGAEILRLSPEKSLGTSPIDGDSGKNLTEPVIARPGRILAIRDRPPLPPTGDRSVSTRLHRIVDLTVPINRDTPNVEPSAPRILAIRDKAFTPPNLYGERDWLRVASLLADDTTRTSSATDIVTPSTMIPAAPPGTTDTHPSESNRAPFAPGGAEWNDGLSSLVRTGMTPQEQQVIRSLNAPGREPLVQDLTAPATSERASSFIDVREIGFSESESESPVAFLDTRQTVEETVLPPPPEDYAPDKSGLDGDQSTATQQDSIHSSLRRSEAPRSRFPDLEQVPFNPDEFPIIVGGKNFDEPNDASANDTAEQQVPLADPEIDKIFLDPTPPPIDPTTLPSVATETADSSEPFRRSASNDSSTPTRVVLPAGYAEALALCEKVSFVEEVHRILKELRIVEISTKPSSLTLTPVLDNPTFEDHPDDYQLFVCDTGTKRLTIGYSANWEGVTGIDILRRKKFPDTPDKLLKGIYGEGVKFTGTAVFCEHLSAEEKAELERVKVPIKDTWLVSKQLPGTNVKLQFVEGGHGAKYFAIPLLFQEFKGPRRPTPAGERPRARFREVKTDW